MSKDEANKRVVLAAVCLAALVLPIDFSGVAMATTAIGQDLSGSPTALAWVVNAFMLSFGSTLLAMGALADARGRRRVFLSGLGVFVLVSLVLCASPALVFLDIGRAIQGVAAAAILAGGTAALAQEFAGHARARAMSLLGATFGGGLAFGPTIAGALVSVAGWRAIFASGALVGAAAFALVYPRLRETRDPNAVGVDWWGAASFSICLAALTAAMLEGPSRGWTSIVVLALLAVSTSAAAGFIFVERTVTRPMLDLSLFRIPRFIGVQALPVATCFAYVVLLVMLPTWLVAVERRGEIESGLIMLALSMPMLVVPYAAASLSASWPAGPMSAAGLAIAAGGLFWLARISPAAPAAVLVAPLMIIGCGAAVPWGLMDGLSLSVVPPDRAGMAAGIFSTVRVAGEGLAIAAARGLFAILTAAHLGAAPGGEAEAAAVAVGQIDAARHETVVAAAESAFPTLLHALGALALLAALVILATLRDRPASAIAQEVP